MNMYFQKNKLDFRKVKLVQDNGYLRNCRNTV